MLRLRNGLDYDATEENYYTQQSSYWNAYSRTAGEEIPCLLWNRRLIIIFSCSQETSSDPCPELNEIRSSHLYIICLSDTF
jgi:hypothetical protein